MQKPDYGKAEIEAAIQGVGATSNDIIYSHFDIGSLGIPACRFESEHIANMFLEALDSSLGSEGGFLTPAFSYSFCKGELFDPVRTPSDTGIISNTLLGFPGIVRSVDPIFSVLARGLRAIKLLTDLPQRFVGPDTIYDKLLSQNALICNFGVSIQCLTFIHHVEFLNDVPYRYDKIFTGVTVKQGQSRRVNYIYFVRALDDSSNPNLKKFKEDAREEGLLKEAPLGRNKVYAMRTRDILELATRKLKEDPWYLTTNVVPADLCR